MSVVATLLSVLTLSGSAPVSLTVRYSDGSGHGRVAHLRCRGTSMQADGFLRSIGAARACRHARRKATFLATRPSTANRVCTQIYGGPERARITGTIGARRIDRRFKRTNGCEIADWEHAEPLVPRPRAGRRP